MKNNILSKEEILISNNLDIKSMIYTIRGQQVMLDSDLAMVYGYSVKDLNRQVKNNINKFPIDFMFQLAKEEVELLNIQVLKSNITQIIDDNSRCNNCTLNESQTFDDDLRSKNLTLNKTQYFDDSLRCKNCTLNEVHQFDDSSRSQIVTLNETQEIVDNSRSKISTMNVSVNKTGMHTKYLPYVFTEQGIYMLATVLKGELATAQTIYIIRSFKQLRHMYIENNLLLDKIISNEVKLLDHDNKFNEVFSYIDAHKEVKEKIFYNGQVYEAFSFISELISKANCSIILIDNYIDFKTLNILAKKKKDVSITIYTKDNKLTPLYIETFNKEMPSLSIIKTNKFHDRFLILDNKSIYLIGASIKDAGNKTFAITEMNKNNIKKIKEELNDDS